MSEFRLAFKLQPNDRDNKTVVAILRLIADQIEQLGPAAVNGVIYEHGVEEMKEIGSVLKDALGAWAIVKNK